MGEAASFHDQLGVAFLQGQLEGAEGVVWALGCPSFPKPLLEVPDGAVGGLGWKKGRHLCEIIRNQ